MSNDYNNSVLIGRIVRDTELKEKNGKKYCQFSLAVNSASKNEKGEYTTKGNFFNLVIYGKYAESMAPYLTQGKQAVVYGTLTQKTIEVGESKYSTISFNVKGIQLLGGSGNSKEENNLIVQESEEPMDDFNPEEYTG